MVKHDNKQDKDPILTPFESAFVINHFSDQENERSRARGWDDKVSFGEVAVHITQGRYGLLPDGQQILTAKEAAQGVEYIENPLKPEKSEAYNKELEHRVDTRGISYDEARRELDEEGWE